MKKIAFFLLLLFSMSVVTAPSFAQGKGKAKGHHKHGSPAMKGKVYKSEHKYRGGGPPSWAPAHGYRAKNHVYFPDYYTFYDPNRNGYIYWHNNSWLFSPRVPSFLANIDLGRARIQILGDLPLTTRPEPGFNRYYQLYPPSGTVNINIPHPPLPRR